jgi:DNA-binding LacI/PurR family transcriptional regulator
MQKGFEYLYMLGHWRMAFVGHHPGLQPLMDCKETLLELIRQNSMQVESAVRADRDGPQGGYQAARALLTSGWSKPSTASSG